MEIATKYNPAEVEDKWYKYWMDNQFFHSEPDEREPYTIVIPPPNVTGILHMGHMLNNTIQDILVRRARMQGKNACWVPGTDHASIATEAKVVAKLAAEGIQKSDLTREAFLEHAWEWTHKHGGIILEQLKKLGASCDWDRTAFTMDKERSESVINVFVDLYNKGLIYRGVRMVNWDPQAQTALSDEEVIHKEVNGKLYYLRYRIKGEKAPSLPPPTGEEQDSENLNKSQKSPYQTADKSLYGILKDNAANLRKFSTEAETILWSQLRDKQLNNCKFRRQHIIEGFIVDFVCLSKQLIIEVDGGYHNKPEVKQADEFRTSILNEIGYQMLRFTNEEVINDTANVLRKIEDALLLPRGGRPGGGLEDEGAEEYAIVATTRPETIFGDVAVCINPNDQKNQHLRGKTLIVPIANHEVPVIEDEYVDIEFGTGCLKVTPAHDVNDYMLGDKYNLESIDIFNNDGTLNAHGLHYEGVDRFEVRKRIEKELEENDLLEKTEPYTNNVGFSERTDAVIEPKLSMQWFLKMGDISKPALDAVMNDTIQLHPEKFKNTYRHWMENIRDWNISRQLWWGHRIPAYYLPDGGFVVAESDEKALELARERNPQLTMNDLQQDEDCLDTWFSSWLWPISVFDGINQPENKDIQYYYPTNDLVTAPEILFFWVARMIIAGYEYTGKPCFNNVYLTGIVRDKLGRKMSKSLGNSPDPIELMKRYGADGVRMGMLLTSAAGNDLPFDESLCEQGRNFNNKIWNAFRLVKGWTISPLSCGEGSGERLQPETAKTAIRWFESVLAKTIAEMDDLFSKYRLSEALMMVYKLFWDEFSSWYLEMVKPAFGQPIDRQTYESTLSFFDSLLRLLHPFMPFITEELWQALYERKSGESIMVSLLPSPPAPQRGDEQSELITQFDLVKEIIAGVRTIRLQKNIPNKDALQLQVIGDYNPAYDSVIAKMCNLSSVEKVSEKQPGAVGFLVGTIEFSVPLNDKIDVEAELEKLHAELIYQEGFLQSVLKKLSNERFVQNAKPEIVENERKKQADAESKIALLKENMKALGK